MLKIYFTNTQVLSLDMGIEQFANIINLANNASLITIAPGVIISIKNICFIREE